MMIVTGILVAFIVNAIFASSGDWRSMLGLAAVPSLVLLIGCAFVPETPRFLGAKEMVPTDVYDSGHPWAPYFTVRYGVAAGPEALPARARHSPTTFVDPTLVRDHRALAGSPQIVRLRLREWTTRP